MSKPTLFFDFDNCKFDTLPATRDYLNQRYGVKSVLSDYVNSPYFDEILAKYLPPEACPTRDEIYEDFAENFLTSIALHADVRPMAGLVEIMPKLAERYRLWTVTARQKHGAAVIRHLLDLHIPGCIEGIHSVWERVEARKFRSISKRDFILSFPGEKVAFFDDSVNEVGRVQDILPSYLFDPDGVNDKDDRVKLRVRSWYEIGEIFLAS